MYVFNFSEDKLRRAILRLRSLGITQKELANACEIDPANLSRFISGKSSFSGDNLFRLFNLTYSELFRIYGKIQDFE